METQVLIPPEFSLVLTAAGAKKSREQVATVFTTARIPQGTVLYPFQGTVRTDKLDIYAYLDEHDVSSNCQRQVSGSTCPLKRTIARRSQRPMNYSLRSFTSSKHHIHPPMTTYGKKEFFRVTSLRIPPLNDFL